ncbi:selenocysteine-specific translation elongation factor [Limisalsivibrio acetivorans]|uniref:selenocysteine-specific translation elongation factor n=1 Tax=Limisalsivibrio acetivorans TaxID=1304888 RepID=UPI0003B63851|nr:selenocysteine-specific translation elongation factor [Limisalsivibrio acetivorans]
MKRSVVFGTAGHIDHGKSTIVRNLTGKDPDRLREEQERGITVDLGFAGLEHNGMLISFVDVPGHERLVKNMIAGATGIDGALFAVDACEGIKPQTEEHLNIIETLGITHAVVAVTKTDLINESELCSSMENIQLFFGDSLLEDISYVKVQRDLPETYASLLDELAATAQRLPGNRLEGRFMLRVDRAFAVKGFGNVVTGTAVSGVLNRGDELIHYPAGKRVRVKNIQVHDNDSQRAEAHQRVALNVPDASEPSRGDILSDEAELSSEEGFYASLKVFDRLPSPADIKHNRTYPVYIGTEALEGKIIIPGGGRIRSGEELFVFVRLNRRYTPVFAERFLIRGLSPQITIAGGKVLAMGSLIPERKVAGEILELIHNGSFKEALSLISEKRPEGFRLPPPIQLFGDETDISVSGILTYGKLCVSDTLVSGIISSLTDKLRTSSELSESEINDELSILHSSLKKPVKEEFLRKVEADGYVFKNGRLKREKLEPFEEEALRALDIMRSDPLLSNRSLLAERLGTDEKTAEKYLVYLTNRELVIRLADKVYVTAELLNSFVSKGVQEAESKGSIELKDMREHFDLPRKLLVPLMDQLDKTGMFITRDKKRFLK